MTPNLNSAFKINEPLEGVVATVVESKSDNFKVGDTVGNSHGRKYFKRRSTKVDSSIELSYYLSILG
jgi:NADPH-dependent curcumin reductase CurA